MAIAYAVLIAVAVRLRLGGLDPASLWIDDAWVGFIVRHATWPELLTYGASAPMGFCALLKIFHGIADDPELSLQIVPFACALMLIPAIGLTVTRLTGWRSLGILAAVVMVVNPRLNAMSVRVKQYSSDALIVTLLLLAGLPRLEDRSPARLLRLAAGSLAAMVVSYASLFASLPLLHLPLLARRKPGEGDVAAWWRSAGVVGTFDLVVGLFYWLRLRNQSHPDLQSVWSPYFLPTDSFRAAFGFAVRRSAEAVIHAFPRAPSWNLAEVAAVTLLPLFLLIAGAVSLSGSGRRRLEASFFFLFFGELLIASAFHVYPFAGRPFAFTVPVMIALAAIGLGALASEASRRSRTIRLALPTLFVSAAVTVGAAFASEARYPESRGALLVARMDGLAGRRDLVILHPRAAPVFGYYTTRPIEPIIRASGSLLRFRPLGWNLLVLPENGVAPVPANRLKRPKRLLYLVTRGHPLGRSDLAPVKTITAKTGLRPVETFQGSQEALVVYERRERGDRRLARLGREPLDARPRAE